MNNFDYTLDDFKKWMKDQKGFEPLKRQPQKQKEIVGTYVESKTGIKKLIAKMEPEKGELHELAADFKREGGVVKDVDGKLFLIEVSSGEFTVPRHCVKRS